MKWMKKSMKNLELHRQELLQAKRNSVDRTGRKDSIFELTSGVMEETKSIRDLQDILGPLPKIPDARESGNWSRRVSGVSGIYEEIPNGDFLQRRTSRGSIASGIYEEMRPPKTGSPQGNIVTSTPPAPILPVRKRINTNEIDQQPIPRSYTNPETELARKKKYLVVLENMFSRSKRSSSVSEETPIYANSQVVIRQKNQEEKLSRFKSKRNSFSTPDLTSPCLFDNFESFDDVSLESFDSNVFIADDQALSNECIPFQACNPTPESFTFDLNVSDQIQPNFNFSCNMSTVNLVGANLNSASRPSKVLVDDLSGYCVMAPIQKDRKKSSDSDKENEVNLQATCDDQIYEIMNMNASTPSPEKINLGNSHIYQNLMPNTTKTGNISAEPLEKSENDDLKKTHRKSTSIDDKVPSYYPNNCDLIKSHRRKSNSVSDKINIRHLNTVKVSHCENLYISSPQKILDQRKRLDSGGSQKPPVKLRALKTSSTLYSVIKSDENKPHLNSDSDAQLHSAESHPKTEREQEMNTKNNERSPRIYQKYATLTRLSPNKYLEKCAKKSNDMGGAKKFASLPRFKKFDFSPLKMKINSVLQRHNSEGF
ncbi:unnamed protein product [Hermetia illucens]|uniref:Uncharacterized protein n=1 Tax=Hermetia illucens TaxID=343691 RepID=A0A7R8UCJ7_HERIL|nr:unnamed protein product [Hermetia illucens]